MDTHFILLVGLTTVEAKERETGGPQMFFVQMLSNDRYESAMGEEILGSSVPELVANVKKTIINCVDSSPWTYEARQFKNDSQDRQRKRIKYADWVDFLNSMSNAS